MADAASPKKRGRPAKNKDAAAEPKEVRTNVSIFSRHNQRVHPLMLPHKQEK